MNASLTLAAAFLAALTTLASAIEVPKKVPQTRYSPLWNESPFTTKPITEVPIPEKNPFEDMALRGISPLAGGGYLITVVTDKKHPEETEIINTARSTEYKVEKVERDPINRLGTVVHIKKGSVAGTITYDEKISSAPKTPQPQKQQQPGAQPQQIPGQPTIPGQPGTPDGIRQPRQRVVTPGVPGATPGAIPLPSSSTGGNRGFPGSRPGSSSSRPDSRGSSNRGRPPGR
ncbi:MAG: hypothetical protein J0M04_12215 [Verrucomicrobia bacterium]|nr:hypothetical protein [Verrucomicrobiota bacterium]